ncbi:hypothetical protein BDK92_1091 [Micromonospora pisi]|uniref:Uncharacterized protein n=1 Tax=Micromonospora pisi TaxID=589240 RepID=A0A495JDA8_9ACTN|nr:hypothetical protein BDK92_1091 [Micromonospora pisi]
MTSTAPREIAERFYISMADGDAEALAELLHPAVTVAIRRAYAYAPALVRCRMHARPPIRRRR